MILILFSFLTFAQNRGHQLRHQATISLAGRPSFHFTNHLPISPANKFYIADRYPLKQNPFARLPVGAVQPQGWLKTQLQLEANGFTGHLEQISQFLVHKGNAWRSPKGVGVHGWEETPYWLRGYGDLAYILGNKKMIADAQSWITPMIESQRADGWFGPRSNLTAGDNGKPDVWPNMLALQCLQSNYEYTKNPKILTMMTNYFRWENDLPQSQLLKSYWENERAADNIMSVIWLYNRTGEPWLLGLVSKLHRAGADWVSGVVNYHGVNFAQSFREPAELGLLTKKKADFKATESDYKTMRDEYGKFPGGMYAADENARPGFTDPRQATETCAMVEMMMSDEYLIAKIGDPTWADRCEDVTFNDLPAAMTSNEKALHYLTSVNLASDDGKNKSPGVQDGGPMFLFNPFDYRCCQHNSGMGWPKFTESLWMATPSNGLATVLFAPSVVTAKVGTGQIATIDESTSYPFRSRILLKIHVSQPSYFPLTIRIPRWCKSPSFTLDGHPLPRVKSDWVILTRKWKSGDKVSINFPMKVRVTHWAQQNHSVSVSRGPLTYSLKIGEKYTQDGGTAKWPALAIEPTTPWNFGLDLKKGFKVVKLSIRTNQVQPFAERTVPIEIEAYGRQIPQWTFDRYGLVADLQPSPALTTQPLQKIILVPMGSARLRIASFPTVSTQPSAIKWVAPRLPKASLKAVASHCYSGDSVDALTNGSIPKNSDDQTIPRFTWWDHLGTQEWVEINLPKSETLTSSKVYWFDDQATGGGCRVPKNWNLSAWVNGHWLPVTLTNKRNGISRYPVVENQFNEIYFNPVKTTKLRIDVQLQLGFSGGILQWIP